MLNVILNLLLILYSVASVVIGIPVYIELFVVRNGSKPLLKFIIILICGPMAWMLATIDFCQNIFKGSDIDAKIESFFNKIAGKPSY